MSTKKEAPGNRPNNRQLPVDGTADRHSCPGFRQRTNANRDVLATFRARIPLLREVIEHITITVPDELVAVDR